MADGANGGKPYWSDAEITVDRDGIPHYTGAVPSLMKEYTRRVRFAFGGLEGDGKDAEAEVADLLKKQCRFGRRLIDALHGEAWRAVEHLVMQPEKIRKKDGFEEVLKALGSIEKEGVIRKTEAFDKFFESTRRSKGEAIDAYLRRKNQAWRDLRDLDEASAMSEDLLAYFLLKGCGLSREDRRAILLANKSTYSQNGIEQSLRVSFHDIHEREKQTTWRDDRSRKHFQKRRQYANEAHADSDEDEEAYFQENWSENEMEGEPDQEEAYYGEEVDGEDQGAWSDAGASGDEDVYQAYASMDKSRQTYKDARKKLREVQKSRGFYRGDRGDRRASIQQEKQRSRCAACSRIGHWAGDPECPRTSSQVGPKKGSGKKGKGSGKGKKRSKAAYAVSPQPMFFSLQDEDDDLEAHGYMVTGKDAEDEGDMEQDDGRSYLDDRRKIAHSYASSEWDKISEPPMPSSSADGRGPSQVRDASREAGRFVEENQEMIRPKISAKVEVREVSSFAAVRPSNMEKMKAYELHALCDQWGIYTSGGKWDLIERLKDLFDGKDVPKKRCSLQFVRLVEEDNHSVSRIVRESPARSVAASASSPGAYPLDPGGPRSYPQRVDLLVSQEVRQVPALPKYYSPGSRSAGSASAPKSPPAALTRSGPLGYPITAADLRPGEMVGALVCQQCSAPMVARQNRRDAGWFFACSRWPSSRCPYTLRITEGLDIINGVRPPMAFVGSPEWRFGPDMGA